MCICASGGSQGGAQGKLQKLSDGSARSSKTKGSKTEWHGPPAPPGLPSAPPKGPPTIGKIGLGHVLKTASLKMYGFPNEIHGFLKSTKNLHVAPGSVVHPFFCRSWEPRGGPGPPLGILSRFLGGPWAPKGAVQRNRGGPGGGPGTPF